MKRGLAWVALLLFVPVRAWANPHALPFSYPTSTLLEGGLEVEQYVDMTPVRALDSSGEFVITPRSILTTELEYGLFDRLELGLYLQLTDTPGSGGGDSGLRFDGIKERLHLRLSDPEDWPIDVSIYGELAQLRNEFEIEGKIILEKRLDRFQILVNLWAEHEFYFSGRREWVLHPTAGVSYELFPALSLGVEYWLHWELEAGEEEEGEEEEEGAFNPAPHHYLGPTVLWQAGKLWVAAAPYFRIDKQRRDSQLGDEFGRIWFRAIVGIEL